MNRLNMLKIIKSNFSFLARSRGINFDKVKVIKSTSNDINLNLSLENLIIDSHTVDCPILYLWQNDKNIVIGKYQNPWKECNIQKMKENNVQLARRKSGGGAVFQDMGNIVYSFILPNTSEIKDFKEVNNEVLSNLFKKLDINAEFSGRNDIQIEGKKFSGNAFRIIPTTPRKQGKSLHHGTMLLDVDMNGLSNYLNVNKIKLISKGVDSVRSRVINISEIKPNIKSEQVYKLLEESFIEYYAPKEIENIEVPNNNTEWNVENDYKLITSWEWLYGGSPSFTNSLEFKFNWGLVDLSLNVENGLICSAQLFSDTLQEGLIENIRSILSEIDFSQEKYSYDDEGVKALLTHIRLIFSNISNINLEYIQYIDEMIKVLPTLV